ncbi:DUF5753 domain-containing protein [Streptomyces sp. N2-109]|uniref:DUF5753 domain-containing protein n=1 Tax=Streptomyces gossypii TaxID=2883101 RepID=A0ABT2K197_9ACTN|nr:DUF5753 domain-containing protein [Streptomyces gossypii]
MSSPGGPTPTRLLDLVGLENEVSECRGFQPGLIPGLFQTEAYATAVIQGGATGPLSDDEQTKVRVRLERQKAVTRDGGEALSVWMVLGEAALRQQVGGPAVLREQLLHLRARKTPRTTAQPSITCVRRH